ncbi:MAG TPA: pirin-like C-terminal cupin domain-containing protein, partial [Bacillota bacterium]|nr:pirin-like C-terminal cupin domain-containing protein [Bacillota bacterium]
FNMEVGATYTLPKASEGVNRTIYFYEGDEITVAGTKVQRYNSVKLLPDAEVLITAGTKPAEILLLQGRPIGEPVIQYGPFVMNTKQEIMQAFDDYHKTQFGGWPWPKQDQVHARENTRFAKYADGVEEKKES